MTFLKAVGGFLLGFIIIPLIISLLSAGILLGLGYLGMGEAATIISDIAEWGLLVLMLIIMYKSDHKAVGTGILLRIILDVVMLIIGFTLAIPYL